MKDSTSYFKKILRSYAVAVFLPVMILCVLLYRIGVLELIASELQNRRILLKAEANMLDQRMDEYYEIALMMSMEEQLLSIDMDMSAIEGMEVVSRLKSYVNTNAFFDEIIVQSVDAPYLYTSSGTVNQLVLLNEYGFSTEDSEAFGKMLYSETSQIHYFTSASIVMRFVPFPILMSKQKGCAIYVLKMQTLVRILDASLDGENSALLLVDENGQTIYAHNSLGNITLTDTKTLRESDSDQVWIDGCRCMLVLEKINSTGWTLMWLRPMSLFYYDMRFGAVVIVIIAIILLSGFLMNGMARRQYAPIRMLSRSVPGGGGNELDNIGAAVRDLQNLNQQVHRQRRLLRESLILRLLNGEPIAQSELESACVTLGMFSSCESVQVAAIDCGSLVTTPVMDALRDDIEEKYGMQGEAYAVLVGREKDIVLVYPDSGTNQLPDLLYDAENCLKDHLGCTCTFGISMPHPINKLDAALLEARAALGRATSDSPDNVIFFESSYIAPQLDRSLNKYEHLLAYALRRGNEQEALATLGKLLDDLRERYSIRQLQRYYQFRIAETVVHIVTDDSVAQYLKEGEYDQLSPLLTSTLTYASYEDFGLCAREIVGKVCRIIARINGIKQDEFSQQVCDWIHLHLSDFDLSLDTLSDAMGYSSAYWSRFFHDRLGVNFNEYVWNERLEQCKKQLRETNLSVKDIVVHVGYIDASSFIRRFKQSEGCTPGQYRLNHREEETAQA